MGYWIALGIVIITVIAFVVAIMQMENKVTSSLSNIEELEDTLNNSSKFLQTNVTYLKETAEEQMARANTMIAHTQEEMTQMTVLKDEVNALQDNVNYLNEHKAEYGRALYDTGLEYVKEETPRRWGRIKEISKRTMDKQNERYRKGEDK